MPRAKRFLAAAAFLSYPVLCHAAVALADARWAAAGVALLGATVAVSWLGARLGAALGVLLLVAALGLAAVLPAAVVYAPPIALNLALCALFGVSLSGGSEPLVGRFARLERGGGPLPGDLARYTRRLTVVWTLFFALMAGISAALALHGPELAWSLFTNLVNYLLVALFFALEYAYRRLRFRHYVHASPAEFVRRLAANRVFARPADGR
jgi:uncharacterized membrane protein